MLLQNVYANMGGNVLVHVSAPALGLAAAQWAVVSWGESQVMRESITDAKYIYRSPHSSTFVTVHFILKAFDYSGRKSLLTKGLMMMQPLWALMHVLALFWHAASCW